MHGDAAFAGQGVVAECFALLGLKGYRTGGTIHFIVNNQIGFTTSPRNSRSSPYPSDVALMVEAPIFHVNGDDPEAVVFAAKVATEYRQKFGKDVVVDMFCYRRFGHNEGDDPTMTQPLMYAKIKDHPSTRELYAAAPGRRGRGHPGRGRRLDRRVRRLPRRRVRRRQDLSRPTRPTGWTASGRAWRCPSGEERRGDTGVPMQKLLDLGRKITTIPERLDVHKTVRAGDRRPPRGHRDGRGHRLGARPSTWPSPPCSTRAIPVRLSGQDSVRGTFTQRHSDIVDQTTEEHYIPLQQPPARPGPLRGASNSALSEEAVLGFEYGFSLTDPNTLTLWEAQFGDFVNGAQVVIDQFISSGERKWLRMSGLVMLLPHGYEGQGPEHSSARLERFLQLCAEDNMQVVNCTTPANYFHVLRRQMHPRVPQAADRHDAQVAAASQEGGLEPGRTWPRAPPSTACWSTTPRPAATSAASR